MYPKNRKTKDMKKGTKAQQIADKLQYQFVQQLNETPISNKLEENEKMVQALFSDCSDFVIRRFQIEEGIQAMIVFVDGLVNTDLVNDAMKALMILEGGAVRIENLNNTTLPVSQIQASDTWGDFLISILGGDTGLFVEHNDKALLLGIRGPQNRSIGEPETEAVIRGPREGFIENIRTNTSLLRRRIKTPQLKMKPLTCGKQSNTSLVISYIDGICAPSIIEEVEKRIAKIDADAILESGFIEEYIQDSSFSPFPQIQYTERPDTVAAALLQGRVAILTDGTPFALLVPTVFWDLLQANEDYYERFEIATLIRWLRYLFLMLSLTTPALYIAATTFHQDMLPTQLLLSIAAAREAIPFPALIEALIMEVTFEALREAGLRLPRTIGQTVSILGALVIGQAAVQAGIVSAPMVIIVSITGIASFTIPNFSAAISVRMLRFPLMFAAASFGMYGILLGLMLILGHMAGLRSFGIPYLSPVGPMSLSDLKDVALRSPMWMMDRRPSFLPVMDADRIGHGMKDELMAQGGQKGKFITHEHDSESLEGADLDDR